MRPDSVLFIMLSPGGCRARARRHDPVSDKPRRVGSGSRIAARAGALRQSLQLSPPGRAGTLAASGEHAMNIAVRWTARISRAWSCSTAVAALRRMRRRICSASSSRRAAHTPASGARMTTMTEDQRRNSCSQLSSQRSRAKARSAKLVATIKSRPLLRPCSLGR